MKRVLVLGVVLSLVLSLVACASKEPEIEDIVSQGIEYVDIEDERGDFFIPDVNTGVLSIMVPKDVIGNEQEYFDSIVSYCKENWSDRYAGAIQGDLDDDHFWMITMEYENSEACGWAFEYVYQFYDGDDENGYQMLTIKDEFEYGSQSAEEVVAMLREYIGLEFDVEEVAKALERAPQEDSLIELDTAYLGIGGYHDYGDRVTVKVKLVFADAASSQLIVKANAQMF